MNHQHQSLFCHRHHHRFGGNGRLAGSAKCTVADPFNHTHANDAVEDYDVVEDYDE